jgi:hypothetical protein
LGSIGIHVEQSGGRKLILRQPSNGLGDNVKKFTHNELPKFLPKKYIIVWEKLKRNMFALSLTSLENSNFAFSC